MKRDFSLPIDRNWIADYKKNIENRSKELFATIEKRADKLLGIWRDREIEKLISSIVNKAFEKHPEGCLITPEVYKQLLKDITEGLEEYLVS